MEVLIVLVIISILTALITFAGTKIKRSLQIRNSIGKLQQIYVVVSTYRTDWGGDGYVNYSHPDAYYGLGIPTMRAYEINRLGMSETFLASPCGFDKMIFESFLCGVGGWITYVAPLYEPAKLKKPKSGNLILYGDYLNNYKENAVLFIDPYCNSPNTSMQSPYLYKRGHALLLSGKIVEKYDLGDASSLNLMWYSDPSE